jgi:hypothetical protein
VADRKGRKIGLTGEQYVVGILRGDLPPIEPREVDAEALELKLRRYHN